MTVALSDGPGCQDGDTFFVSCVVHPSSMHRDPALRIDLAACTPPSPSPPPPTPPPPAPPPPTPPPAFGLCVVASGAPQLTDGAYWPLYETEAEANALSPSNGGSQSLNFAPHAGVFYTPNGFPGAVQAGASCPAGSGTVNPSPPPPAPPEPSPPPMTCSNDDSQYIDDGVFGPGYQHRRERFGQITNDWELNFHQLFCATLSQADCERADLLCHPGTAIYFDFGYGADLEHTFQMCEWTGSACQEDPLGGQVASYGYDAPVLDAFCNCKDIPNDLCPLGVLGCHMDIVSPSPPPASPSPPASPLPPPPTPPPPGARSPSNRGPVDLTSDVCPVAAQFHRARAGLAARRLPRAPKPMRRARPFPRRATPRSGRGSSNCPTLAKTTRAPTPTARFRAPSPKRTFGRSTTTSHSARRFRPNQSANSRSAQEARMPSSRRPAPPAAQCARGTRPPPRA